MSLRIRFLALFCATGAVLAAPPRTEVRELHPLLAAAIDSPAGAAHGVLVGPEAQAIAQRFGSASPITVEVTTAHRYAQPGCSRLKVLVAQAGVLLPGKSRPERRTVEMGIDYCRDGAPPARPPAGGAQ